MNLHLVQMPVDMRWLHRWAGERLGPQRLFDEGDALHRLLGELFGPAVLQPFRLMVAPGELSATLYAYCGQDRAALADTANVVGTPAALKAINLDGLQSVERPAHVWRAGQRLGFDLRMRPVVRLSSCLSGENSHGKAVAIKKGSEVDAFLARVLRGESATREEVYLDWLEKRLSPAASLERQATRLAGFSRHRGRRHDVAVEGPDVVVHGTLTVQDPAAFAALLARGVGRHRSYGYGMLLLRPPQRQVPC
ncbi:MAG: type I-E CRISPR-associated protein Cas6/Cse3/CasE [Rhizobiaceae bacterium]|nr:type I-E CRISPR-associated protein Cas6/Cse3/CasE [Rhizobiaceae bacterium]